jgi:hypothetical protein
MDASPEVEDYWQKNNLKKPSPWIVCAAIKKGERIICGPRHYDSIMRQQIQASEGREFWLGAEQGFVNQFGEFLSREEAWFISHQNGQYKRNYQCHQGRLFSEDLY